MPGILIHLFTNVCQVGLEDLACMNCLRVEMGERACYTGTLLYRYTACYTAILLYRYTTLFQHLLCPKLGDLSS